MSLPASLAPPHLSQVTSPLGRKSGAVRFSQTAWLQTSDGPAEAPRPGAAEPEPHPSPFPAGSSFLPAGEGILDPSLDPGSRPAPWIPDCSASDGRPARPPGPQ